MVFLGTKQTQNQVFHGSSRDLWETWELPGFLLGAWKDLPAELRGIFEAVLGWLRVSFSEVGVMINGI